MRKPRLKVILPPVLIGVILLWALGELMKPPTTAKALYQDYVGNARMARGLWSLSQRLPAPLTQPLVNVANQFGARAGKRKHALLASSYMTNFSITLTGAYTNASTRNNIDQFYARAHSAVPDTALFPSWGSLSWQGNLVHVGVYCRTQDVWLIERVLASDAQDGAQTALTEVPHMNAVRKPPGTMNIGPEKETPVADSKP